MGKTWGKIANRLRKASLNNVDEHPQEAQNQTQTHNQAVQNPRFHHLFHPLNQQLFPQLKTHQTPLLKSMFSPLSTQPITITTKEIKLER